MERRLVAILAADVAGYSHLTELSEEASTATLRSYCAVLEDVIAAHHGHIFSRAGDSVVAEFPSIVEALRCAVEIQHEITDLNLAVPQDTRMQFRIGVNLGDVITEADNLYGTGVNVAARLEELAEPGGICISRTVYDQVRKIIEISFEDIGERRLKNIAEPVQVYRVLPAPRSWLRRQLARSRKHPRASAAAGVLFLCLATAAGAAYLRQPPAFWSALIGEAGYLPLPNEASIAVLPLGNLGGPEQEYFSDGLTNDITSELSKFKNLFVIAANSAFTYKDKPAKAQEIGRDLGVRYLLEGTVQKVENRIRINAQLIDAGTGRHLWADRYDREGQDLFAIQDDIIGTVVARLAINVDAAEKERVMRKQTAQVDAYDHYLRGRKLFEDFSQESLSRAKEEFSEAIRLDGNFARAYAWLGYAHLEDYKEGWSADAEESAALAYGFAAKSVDLAPDDYYTHWTLATIYMEREDMQRAFAEYEKAHALNANDPDMLVELSDLLSFRGEPLRAIEQIELAKRLNPNHPDWYDWSLGLAYFQARKYDEALGALERIKDPPNEAYLLLAICRAKTGKPIPREQILARLRTKYPEWTPKHLERMPFAKDDDQKHWTEGLRMAGIVP